MQQQHESVAALIDKATGLLPAWKISARNGEELSVVLQELSGQLNAHLAEEETEVLPVVRQKITEEEWTDLANEEWLPSRRSAASYSSATSSRRHHPRSG